jgi:hypothetical protein
MSLVKVVVQDYDVTFRLRCLFILTIARSGSLIH